MPNLEKHFYEFGPFRIDTQERVLYRGEEMIPLTPKAVDTLLVLIASRERVIDKDELLKSVWPDTYVEEGALAKNVSALRKALAGGTDEYIATVHKRGYRFVAAVRDLAPVKDVPTSVPGPNPRKWFKRLVWVIPAVLLILLAVPAYRWFVGLFPAGTRRIMSLAVLPLDNPSKDAAQEYFTEGMHEELINTLEKIEALRVISRTSAMIYKGAHKPLPQIARELNVDAIVEGSVLLPEKRVRITVALFEGKTEKQLWAQSYERDLRDVLALQAEVASAIAREIQVKLTRQEKQRLAQTRQVDPESYLAYSYGRYYWNKRTPEGFQKAIEYFQRAIAKDLTYAPAHAGLADALALLGSIGSGALAPKQVMPKAKEAALEAVRLDDNLAESHTSLAYVKLSYDWDLEAAAREFRRAIELNPSYATAHHWYAHYFLARGQTQQAVAEVERAQTLDPLSFIINVGVGWCYYHARQYDKAIEQYRKTLDLNPDFPLTYCTLGMAYVQKKSYEEALAEFNKAKALPGSPAFAVANIAGTYALSGRRTEARRLLAELRKAASQQYVPAIYVAAVYAALDENDQAMTWVQKAYDERSDYIVYLRTEPSFDSLRSDPRFQHLLQLVGSGTSAN
jgi:TolB-like protein/DNA-binding winged helix-turn-helix (wHTH) protein/Flp pilus assembly protein TadD